LTVHNFFKYFCKRILNIYGSVIRNFRFITFLNKSLTTAYFKQSGKIPEDNDLLHTWLKGDLMKGELVFINLIDIPSCAEESLGLRYFIIFSTSLVDIDFRLIFGKGFLKDYIK
jgi:hypothetical protein